MLPQRFNSELPRDGGTPKSERPELGRRGPLSLPPSAGPPDASVLSMIVRTRSEACSPPCLTSVQGFRDGSVVRDTGSAMRQPRIARSTRPTVSHHPLARTFAPVAQLWPWAWVNGDGAGARADEAASAEAWERCDSLNGPS